MAQVASSARVRRVVAIVVGLAVLGGILLATVLGPDRETAPVVAGGGASQDAGDEAGVTDDESVLASTPEQGPASSPASSPPGGAEPTATAAGTATPLVPTAGAPGSAGTPTIPGVVEDPASVPATRPLLCDVTAQRIGSLLGPGGVEDATPDDLRTGSEVLLQTLPDWRDGAIGYPLASDRLALAETVLESWERAVAASDAGDTGAASGFASDGEQALRELAGLEPLPGC